MDADMQAARAWQELVLATHRLHLEMRELVRAGQLDLTRAGQLSARLHEADLALEEWTMAAERSDGV
jgi:hypothetical protein